MTKNCTDLTRYAKNLNEQTNETALIFCEVILPNEKINYVKFSKINRKY